MKTIKLNKEIKMNVLPLCPEGPNKVLNSLCKVIKIFLHNKLNREGRNQKEHGIIIIPIKVLNQFKERLKIVVEGSKTENKFVIIFNWVGNLKENFSFQKNLFFLEDSNNNLKY